MSSHYTETLSTDAAIGPHLGLNLVKWLLNLLWNFSNYVKSKSNILRSEHFFFKVHSGTTHFFKGKDHKFMEGNAGFLEFIRGPTDFTLNHSTHLQSMILKV